MLTYAVRINYLGAADMIRKGDTVKIKQEWQDAGDELLQWAAVEDEDGGRVRIAALGTGLVFAPTYWVR